jgi:hypothetical protein
VTRRSAAIALCLALAACGGGDGGAQDAPAVASTPAPAPTPTPTPSPSPTTASTWWRPTVTDTWQWQLTGTVDTRYDARIYDVDLFDTPQATIDSLHTQGRRVLCYFSAGSSENWRADYPAFAAADMGATLDGWAGERWLDVRSANVRAIMGRRLDLARSKQCDGVEPDNVDGYANPNGLGLTAGDQLAYNGFLADEAHRRGLAVALKNDLDQVSDLATRFDLAVNEQCHEFSECDRLAPFVTAGKPVLNAEYADDYRTDRNGARATLCAAARRDGLRTLVLPVALDGSFRFTCD